MIAVVLVLQHSIKQRSLQGSSEINSPIFGSWCIFCVCFHSTVYLVCLFVCLLQGTRGDFFVVGYLEDHQPHARVRGRVGLGTSISSAVRRMYGR